MKSRYYYENKKGLRNRLEKLPERCINCGHCSIIYFPSYSVSCHERARFNPNCDSFVDREGYRKRNESNPIAKVEWKRELNWDRKWRYVPNPYCPSCGEYAYSGKEGRCIFCSQLLDFSDDPREKDVTVEFEHPTLGLMKATQIGEYHHIWVEWPDEERTRIDYVGKMMTEGELIEYVKRFIDVGEGIFVE